MDTEEKILEFMRRKDYSPLRADELCKAQTPTAKYLENPAASRAAPAPSARAPKASKAPKAAKTDEKNSDKKR